jgi:protein O-mannosyl-transferase
VPAPLTEKTGRAAVRAPQNDGAKPLLYLALALVLASFAIYGNTLFNGFVFDDVPQVLQNPWLRSFSSLPAIFSSHVSGAVSTASNYYRPMMNVLYLIVYQCFGPAPWAFHLLNLLFHAATTVLVFFLALRLMPQGEDSHAPRRLLAPLAGALLFAAHPVHTEAVAWVAGIPDLSFTLFYLLSFYFFLGSGAKERGLSLFFFFLAALSKEPALTLPLVLVAYDLAFNRGRLAAGDWAKRHLPYLAVVVVYLALRLSALHGFAPVQRHAELSNLQCLINVFPLFGSYLVTLLVPLRLNFFHVLHPLSTLMQGEALLWLALCLGFAAAAVVAFRKSAASFVALALFSAPLLPTLYIRALGENSFAERYLYLPSVALSILGALAVAWLTQPSRERLRTTAGAVVAMVVIVFSLQTVQRNLVWKNDLTLWSDTVQKAPDGYLPHLLLGDTLAKSGRLNEAIEAYRRAVALRPGESGAHDHLGSAYLGRGMIDEAIAEFSSAVSLPGDNSDSYNNLGLAYLQKNRPDQAIAQFQRVLERQPDSVQTLNNMGLAYKKMNQPAQAIPYYREALRLRPDVAGLHYNLARVYEMGGQQDKAAEEMRIVQQLQQ